MQNRLHECKKNGRRRRKFRERCKILVYSRWVCNKLYLIIFVSIVHSRIKCCIWQWQKIDSVNRSEGTIHVRTEHEERTRGETNGTEKNKRTWSWRWKITDNIHADNAVKSQLQAIAKQQHFSTELAIVEASISRMRAKFWHQATPIE